MEVWLGINSYTGYCCRILIKSKFEVEYVAEAYGNINPDNLVQNVLKKYNYRAVGQPKKLPHYLKYESIYRDMGATTDFGFTFDQVQYVLPNKK